MTATLHKLTAGDGYLYLIRQVAASDSTERGRNTLSEYYSAKGESPGRWIGSGLASLSDTSARDTSDRAVREIWTVPQGSEVREEQMAALFGEGLHPNAIEITNYRLARGAPWRLHNWAARSPSAAKRPSSSAHSRWPTGSTTPPRGSSVRHDRFAALFLELTTGIRRGQVCGLRWTSVDLEAGEITVHDNRVVVGGHARDKAGGKTKNADQTIALDKDALRAWRESQDRERQFFGSDYHPGDYVFTFEDGRPQHPDSIRQRFDRLAAAAGLSRITFHDLRHSYATGALKAGISPKVVSDRIGHANVGFFLQTYAHVLGNDDRDAAEQAAAFLLGDGWHLGEANNSQSNETV